ncbi:hypothetical protein D3C84_1250420 [compost metagenome]
MSAARSFKKIFTRKRLQEIYTDRIKNSGAIGLDRMRPANLDKNLSAELDHIVEKVHRGEYRFTAYRKN